MLWKYILWINKIFIYLHLLKKKNPKLNNLLLYSQQIIITTIIKLCATKIVKYYVLLYILFNGVQKSEITYYFFI